MNRIASFLALALLCVSPALAIDPDERLDDPELEARARALGQELRCMVCQNQSIDDSDAELARDLRQRVRDLLEEGRSDAEIKEHLVTRFGDFVLLQPPFRASTWALWFGPLLALIAGGVLVWSRLRAAPAAPTPAPAPLSEEERARLDALLAGRRAEEER